MTSKSGGNGNGVLDNWRDYFRSANSDIFDIIEHAIMVAASDCPKEFRVRREKIAELLFTCRLTRCVGCDRVELAVSELGGGGGQDEGKMVINGVEQFNGHHDDGGDDDDGINDGDDDDDDGGSKGSKVNSTTRDDDVIDYDDHGDDDGVNEMEMNMNMVMNNNNNHHESNFSFDDAEALTDEIEEAKEVVDEVFRIKDVLVNYQNESDSVVFESLRRLQLMALNFDILQTTKIGKVVNGVRRHNSKEIRHLARALIVAWKIIAFEWVKATQAIAADEGTPDSVNPSTVEEEEEGLPSPPMDEGAFFSTQTMDFSQFFDGMDDDGNPRNCGEFNKNHDVRGVGRKPSVAKQEPPKRREEPPKQVTPLPKDNKVQQARRQEPVSKANKPLNTQSGPGRPVKPNGDIRVSKDSKLQQKPEKPMLQRRPPQSEKMRSSSDNAVQDKLEATKRKLQERYQQAENAKRQRTIQVMEIQDLPKQGHTKPNPFGKFGNHNRNWANGRR